MFICKLDKIDWGYAIFVFLVPVRNESKITVALDHPVAVQLINVKTGWLPMSRCLCWLSEDASRLSAQFSWNLAVALGFTI